MATVFSTPMALLDAVGTELEASEWLEITQDRINLFADATGDHQWIHVDPERAKDGPFGACIAHTIRLRKRYYRYIAHYSPSRPVTGNLPIFSIGTSGSSMGRQ